MLVIRILVGGLFIATGSMKFAAMGMTVSLFASFGIPAFLAYAVAFCELAGGILILLGLWTCMAASVLAVVMVFATWYSLGAGPLLALPIVVFILLIAILKLGAGKYAVSSKKKA